MEPEALVALVVFTGVVSVYRLGRAGAAVADVLPGRETLSEAVGGMLGGGGRGGRWLTIFIENTVGFLGAIDIPGVVLEGGTPQYAG